MARRVYPMEAGERDRRITLETQTETTGAGGFPTSTWATLATVWAMKQDLRGAERFQADQLSARYDTRWEIPYRSDMDPELVDVPKTKRLVYQGRTHDIRSASLINRREGVELMTLASTA